MRKHRSGSESQIPQTCRLTGVSHYIVQPKGFAVLRRTLGLLVLQVTLLLPSGNQIRGSFDVTLMCVTDLSLRLEVRAIVAQSTTQKGYALRPGSLASRQARDRNCDDGQTR